jgi:radical SAM superfamily enzyme
MGVPSFPRHLESTVLFLRHIPSSVVVERLLCETPSHRLAAPRSFGVKNRFIEALEETMERNGYYEGDSYETT